MVLKKHHILIFCFLLAIFTARGQETGTITGTVKSSTTKAVSAATVSLLRSKDSSVIKLAAADKEGVYVFETIPQGIYIVTATAVDHRKNFSPVVEITAQQLSVQMPVITLLAIGKELNSVTVAARRPLIEQRLDRTILNVDAAITNVGSSALEILEKAPGVSIDREGNISLKGKEGVLVLVDGRPTQLSSSDLVNFLRGMNASQLDQVEIMTNPPARYDAQGNAGIINIKTKKTVSAGYNGTANVSYTQGRYPKTNEGVNFNYREKKINIFSNLSHNYRKSFETLTIQRNIRNGSNGTENYFDQRSHKIADGHSWSGKVGLDFFASKKTTLGVAINAAKTENTLHNDNETNIFTPQKQIESVTLATVDNRNDLSSFNSNLNYRRVLDKKGKELTADFDYVKYRSVQEQFMVNTYPYSTGGGYVKPDTLLGHLPQHISVYSGRADYIHPRKNKGKFEAGVKTSIVRTDNNARYDSIQYGNLVQDVNRSNHFVYEENINAAYLNIAKPLTKKISAQFGLRLENTNARGRLLTNNTAFNRHYTQLFPTAYVQYKVDDKNTLVANLGRRVRRPGYQSLNPFIRFMDKYTYSQGNPDLKPSLGNNYELTHSYRNILTTTLNYTSTSDIVNSVLEQKGREAFSRPSNIASLRQFGIAVSANNDLNKWWKSTINFNAFHNKYKGIVNNAIIDQSATSYVLMVTEQFKVNKTLLAELSGRYRSGWLEGVINAKPVGFVWIGLSQQVMKTNGTLRLTIRDVFYTQKFKAAARYGLVDFNFQEINDSRVLVLGFSYRFNKGKKIGPTKRTEGSANEEQDRIGAP